MHASLRFGTLLLVAGCLLGGSEARFSRVVNRTVVLQVRRVDEPHPYFQSLWLSIGNGTTLAWLKSKLQDLSPGVSLTRIVKNNTLLLTTDREVTELKLMDRLEVWFANSGPATRAETANAFRNYEGKLKTTKKKASSRRRKSRRSRSKRESEPGPGFPVILPDNTDGIQDIAFPVPDDVDQVPDIADPTTDFVEPIPDVAIPTPDESETLPGDLDLGPTPDESDASIVNVLDISSNASSPDFPMPGESDESGPSTDESGPSTDESGPSTEDTGPSTDESGPSTDESGPSTDESGPSTDESGPSTDEPGSSSDESSETSSPSTTESPTTTTAPQTTTTDSSDSGDSGSGGSGEGTPEETPDDGGDGGDTRGDGGGDDDGEEFMFLTL